MTISDLACRQTSPGLRTFACLLLLLVPGASVAQEDGMPARDGWEVVMFPAGDIVPVYVADPHRPNNTVEQRFQRRAEIPGTGSVMTFLSAGGRIGVVRIASAGGREFQVSFDAGLDAVFDASNGVDAVGWNGNYGLSVTTASDAPWAFRLGIMHISGHLGDEYQERTGRQRINYTREEISLAATRQLWPRTRAYSEVGVAYLTRNESQNTWRMQGGLEHEGLPLLGRPFTWYAAADLSTLQERAWRLDKALEGGLVTWAGSRARRIGVGYRDGRSTLGEFTTFTDRAITVFLKSDL